MELVLATVFTSAHVSLFEDVKPLMRRGTFKGLDFCTRRRAGRNPHFCPVWTAQKVLCSLRQKVEIYCKWVFVSMFQNWIIYIDVMCSDSFTFLCTFIFGSRSYLMPCTCTRGCSYMLDALSEWIRHLDWSDNWDPFLSGACYWGLAKGGRGKGRVHDVLHFTSLRQMNVERVVKFHWNCLGIAIGRNPGMGPGTHPKDWPAASSWDLRHLGKGGLFPWFSPFLLEKGSCLILGTWSKRSFCHINSLPCDWGALATGCPCALILVLDMFCKDFDNW